MASLKVNLQGHNSCFTCLSAVLANDQSEEWAWFAGRCSRRLQARVLWWIWTWLCTTFIVCRSDASGLLSAESSVCKCLDCSSNLCLLNLLSHCTAHQEHFCILCTARGASVTALARESWIMQELEKVKQGIHALKTNLHSWYLQRNPA